MHSLDSGKSSFEQPGRSFSAVHDVECQEVRTSKQDLEKGSDSAVGTNTLLVNDFAP